MKKLLAIIVFIAASSILFLVLIKKFNIGRIYYTDLVSPRENVYLATGSDGNYKIMVKSVDGGASWKEVYPDGWLWSIYPTETYYESLGTTDEVVWVKERQACSECDVIVYGIYYSHDLGETWKSVPGKYLIPFAQVNFLDENHAELFGVLEEEEAAVWHHTDDGGKTWKDGHLPAEFLNKANSEPFYYHINNKDLQEGNSDWAETTVYGDEKLEISKIKFSIPRIYKNLKK